MRLRTLITLAALALGTASVPGAPPAAGARILVLNMHAGKDAGGKSNLDGVAGLVKSTDADLVLLQEVDRRTNRSGRVDQVEVLQKSTKYDAAFAASLLSYDGGEYGIAVLSRGGIGYRSTIPLPVTPLQTRAGESHEPRVAQLVLAAVDAVNWYVLNTHIDPSDAQARAQEVGHIVEAIKLQRSESVPFVVGGDFNSPPDDPVQQTLKNAGMRDAWSECGQGDGFTYPADAPAKRIDYLFLTGDLHCSAARVIDTRISDHRPVLVTLK
jgi:endonuclease/exonuclease/phosphatase family metal-dependent hydrolase